MQTQITKERIDSFLSGHDPMERLIKMEIGYDDDKIIIFYRDENGLKKCIKEDFYPFVWTKQVTARSYFNGNRKKLKEKMIEYHIGTKGLRIEDNNGNIHPRMENGYRVMFYAKSPMSFSKFMNFFIEAGRPIYPKTNDKNYGLKDYIIVAPNEQHMISTGKRLFKGYDNYDEVLRVLWDLETEGLVPETDMISQIGIRTNKGFEKIIKITGESREEKFENELKGLIEFFTILAEIDPDVIAGHNTENFDWNFIDVRLQKHGSSLVEFTAKFFNGIGIYKKKKQSVLKLGGEMEYYFPTIKYGTNITDSLHAVRRAQAIDSSMKKADLKYVTKYSKLNKPNRVYVPGKIINTTWADTQLNYAHNDTNGYWFKIDWNKVDRNRNFEKNGLLEGKSAARYFTFIKNNKEILVDSNNSENFDIVTGTYIVERYLLDDLYETDKVELQYNLPNFLVGKLLPVAFDKMCTMGTAAIWKYIMLAWSYENDLAIPELTPTRKFVGGLSRLLSVGYVDKVVKLDYNSLYPSIILTFNIQSCVDITHVLNELLEYLLTQREYFKSQKGYYGNLAKEISEKIKNLNIENEIIKLKKQQEEYEILKVKNDKLQLPVKIICNAYFGSSSAGSDVFPWTDMYAAESITCIGRQMLRLMIYHFSNLSKFNGVSLSSEYNYTPIVGDTDGFNFRMPDKFRYTKENPYIGKGLGRNTKKDKKYYEVEADVAEFEDVYINQAYNGGKLKNGLGIDEFADATINFARKNYADLLDAKKDKIKLVGNTIKSKKMPIYIEKFLDKGIKLLLHGKGKEFLELYYDYVEKIYNLQIPLKDIATVGKIKTSIETYKESCKQLTAAGTKKARQVWYELAIKHKLDVHMGDAIYYINTGNKKSSSDVQRLTKYYYIKNGEKINYIVNENGEPQKDKKGNLIDLTKYIEKEYNKYKKTAPPEDFNNYGQKGQKIKINAFEYGKKLFPNLQEEDILVFNCILLSNDIVEDEDDHYCDEDFEYNKDKYIEMFNKRIRPLLVCFDKSIRISINEKGKEIDNILINNPNDRKFFTEEECKLVSGQPYNITDQDTYEQLMTIEDKEIKFWLSVNKTPPYVEECGINWEEVVKDYNQRMEQYTKDGIKEEIDKYNEIISHMKKSDVESFFEEGILPDELLKFVDIDLNTNNFVSKQFKLKIGSLSDIFDIMENNIKCDE